MDDAGRALRPLDALRGCGAQLGLHPIARARVRYAALALLGLTVLKVFLVDLAAVRTVYRVLSFLVLGVVLLGVSLLYQKTRPPAATP